MVMPSRTPARTRSLDAATGSRRGHGIGTFGPINAEAGAALDIVRRRARYLAANNPWIRNAVGNMLGDLVGTGLRPSPVAVSPEERDSLTTAFGQWTDRCDLGERANFGGLQLELVRGALVDGEALCLIHDDPDGLRLQPVPPERLDLSRTTELDSGHIIVQGVEFDGHGRRVAYWLHPRGRELEPMGAESSVRIEAGRVIHLFEPLAAGQVRGLSGLAAAVLPASDLDQLQDALLVGAKVAAMFAGFIKDVNETAAYDPEAEETEDGIEAGLEPGTLHRLPAGVDIDFSSPDAMRDAPAFYKVNQRHLAAALGCPAHYLDGDLSDANYSSLRAGLLPWRRRVRAFQELTFRPVFLARIWRRWLANELLTGRLDLPANTGADWIPPAFQQVDPEKALKALRLQLNAGLTSRTAAAQEFGRNVADIDAEIQADREREATAGLSFSGESDDNPTE